MTDRGSVSLWIAQRKAGDVDAAQPLWEPLYQRLVGLARKKLGDVPRRTRRRRGRSPECFQQLFSTRQEWPVS